MWKGVCTAGVGGAAHSLQLDRLNPLGDPDPDNCCSLALFPASSSPLQLDGGD